MERFFLIGREDCNLAFKKHSLFILKKKRLKFYLIKNEKDVNYYERFVFAQYIYKTSLS